MKLNINETLKSFSGLNKRIKNAASERAESLSQFLYLALKYKNEIDIMIALITDTEKSQKYA